MAFKPTYKAGIDKEGRPYVAGPSPGGECDWYGGYLYPEYRFATEDQAEVAARVANVAYEQGYQAAKAEIRKALGLK